MAQSATVIALNGQVLAINAAGQVRLLAVGDTLEAGDTVRPAPGASIQLATDDGRTIALDADEALLLGTDTPVPANPEAAAAIQTVIEALERGDDLDELDAAAAGLGGGGEGGGSSFVRLLRITEGVTPLEYEYSFTPPESPREIEGASVTVAEEEVPPPPPPPPPPVDAIPDANPDTGAASVAFTGFKGDTVNFGNHEGGDSFLKGLVTADADVWLVSNASVLKGSLQGDFTLTDQGVGGGPGGDVGSAYVVTPSFEVDGSGSFRFNVTTTLQSGDVFTAKLYQNVDGGWALVPGATFSVDMAGTLTQTHTFSLDEGEYRISFNVDGTTGGADKATATIDVLSDGYFYGAIDTQAATGNIFDNDVYGDGDVEDHTWAFDDGVADGDGNVTVDGQYGTLVVDGDGNYTYTPDGSGYGTETFSYTLTDADGDADSATLTIAVSGTVDGEPVEPLGTEAEGYSLNAASMVVDVPDDTDLEDDSGPHSVRSFHLAPADEGGDSIDLSEVIEGDDYSAAYLDNYLSFGANDSGQTVISIATGADLNGDGIPDALQTITLDNVPFLDFQAYAGESDIDIIQKLLDEGNLRGRDV